MILVDHRAEATALCAAGSYPQITQITQIKKADSGDALTAFRTAFCFPIYVLRNLCNLRKALSTRGDLEPHERRMVANRGQACDLCDSLERQQKWASPQGRIQ